MSILLADDEKPLLHFLAKGLRAEGYECLTVNELHEVVPWIRKHSPKVVVLDRLFGSQDSLSILDTIKRQPGAPMVLMLTALDEVTERVAGLQKGADDYLCKPFDFDELLARIKALSRRNEPSVSNEQDALRFASLTLALDQRIAFLNGKELSVTKIEFELLLYLIENKQKVLSRERILSRVWQTQSDPNTNIVDVYISRLRRKLEGDQQITIQTLRGNGYRLDFRDANT